MDHGYTTNDYLKTCKKCKDCIYQNQDFWFKCICEVYTFMKPEHVFDNKDCEFYTKRTDNYTK